MPPGKSISSKLFVFVAKSFVISLFEICRPPLTSPLQLTARSPSLLLA